MKKPTQPPIGFGRQPQPEPNDPADATAPQPEAAPAPAPPLAQPIFLDDVALYEFLGRYTIQPLAPLSKFEYQLVCLAAGLEQRLRELAPEA